ncbi:MAG: SIS domain-containing protein [Dehalococcoidales bacterium]|jgi:D-sedoheptulose 7-phosphate isomerase
MNKIEEIASISGSGAEYAQYYAKYLSETLSELDFQAIEEVIEVLKKARARGNSIFFIGNGGSMATASHFAEDLAYGTRTEGKKPFRALSLSDSSYLTAAANDEGYENVFVTQLKNLLKPQDVVITISASGNSPNLIKAIEYANRNGGISIGLLGFDGGKMKEICHHCILVKTMKGEYGPVEDTHLILVHIITTYLKHVIQDE